MEAFYKAVVRFIYGFQRTHFELLQLLVQLDKNEERYAQDVPSPAQFLALVAEADQKLQPLPLSPAERASCNELVRALKALGARNQHLVEADFKTPLDEIAHATESCNKVHHLLRACRQIVASQGNRPL